VLHILRKGEAPASRLLLASRKVNYCSDCETPLTTGRVPFVLTLNYS